MRTIVTGACIVANLLLALPACAQIAIDRTVATPETGSVEVFNISGSIRVIGWDRSEVRVTGTLGEGAERLDVTSSGDRVSVRVIIPERARNVRETELEVRVPRRKAVTAVGVSAEVAIDAVTGPVDGRSTSGSVQVSGSPSSVRALSTSGEVRVDATTARVEANSTSGDVRVSGSARESISVETVSGEVEVAAQTPELTARSTSGRVIAANVTRRVALSSVSGELQVHGGRIQYGSFETVSGNIRFDGGLEGDAALSLVSHSGNVTLGLPRDIGARFEVTTFSGDIRNDFGPPAERSNRSEPGRELRFSAGNGEALITVKSFSGSVDLNRN